MLKVINFLPGDYQERRIRRRATFRCLGIAAGSLMLLALAVGLVFVRTIGVKAARYLVEQQYAEASRQIDQLKQLEERKAGLLRKVELSTTLLERVPRSYLLARLTNYLPPGTSLLVLTMKMEDVAAPAGQPPPDGGKTSKASPPAGAKGEPAKVKQFVVRVDGLARTDVDVAEFLQRLTNDPLFQDVDLQFSEEFPYQEKIRMRRFQLGFRLRAQADKILESGKPEELAAVPPAPPGGGS